MKTDYVLYQRVTCEGCPALGCHMTGQTPHSGRHPDATKHASEVSLQSWSHVQAIVLRQPTSRFCYTDDLSTVTDGMSPVIDDMPPVTDDMTPVTDDMTPVIDDSSPVTDDMSPVTDDM
ncbi:hypothetical protein LSAT2_026543 [Lamellibrachia satsuma]|nr:hypothetical protein LSAT2_026543 [Lamellibrachia satsuma]